MTTDPNLHWDGQHWHRWDGRQWQNQGPPADSGLVHPQAAPSAYAPAAYAPAATQPAYGYQPQPAPMRINDSSSKPVETIIAWIGTLITVGYLLPWAIAASRGKSNSLSVFLINLLLGWTLIGWVIALVMACGAHQAVWGGQQVNVINSVAVHNAPYQPPGYQPQAYQPQVSQPPPYQAQAYQPPQYQSPTYQPPTYQPPTNQPSTYQPLDYGSDQPPGAIGAGQSLTKPLPEDQTTVELPDDPRTY